MTTQEETWLPVVGYEGLYEVSDLGRVRSLDRFVPGSCGSLVIRRGRVLRQEINRRTGRPRVCLARDGAKKTRNVSTIVLLAFVGPRGEGQVCCHNDGDVANSRLDNLRWDSQSANIKDAVAHGTHPFTVRTHCPRRHPLVAPNLSAAHPGRTCLACNRSLSARRRAELRGEPFDMQQDSDARYEAIMRGARAA